MLSFENDYAEGAHPQVLQALLDTNLSQQPGYGADAFSQSAAAKIREACRTPNADIFFLAGGTQTNAFVIGSLLRPWEGVLSAETGHVNVHEAGAVEFTGHKVLALPQRDGKLDAGTVRSYLAAFWADPNHSHMVFPGMVYLSHPTEYGTLYTKAELEAIHAVCQEYHIPLFLDGARLGYGIAADPSLGFPEIASCTDVFYIGGTKCGALCGEALVFPQGAPEHIDTLVKQRGALLAKGRLCGVQFDALFTDHLYTRICGEAVQLAMEVQRGLIARGYPLLLQSPTNQQFVILDNDTLSALSKEIRVCIWEPVDETHTAVRIAVSWATTREAVQQLFAVLDRLKA